MGPAKSAVKQLGKKLGLVWVEEGFLPSDAGKLIRQK